MNKSTITRERLEKIKSWRETYGAGSNVMLPAEEAEELARMALAAMNSEPVAWMATYHGEVSDDAIGITRSIVEAQAESFGWEPALTEITPLYRHAQPAKGLELAGWQFKSVNGDWLGLIDEHGKNQAVREGCEVREVFAMADGVNDRDQVRSDHAEWSQATFGNVGPVGPLKHLSKEALEAAAEPGDLSERADMQFLLWDAQRRAGITDEQITQAMIEKLAVNKQREWPEPKEGEPRLHIKEQPAPVVTFYRDGIEAAAKWIDKQREAYDSEHGWSDPDTGAFEFGNDAQRGYSSTLEELAEGIRALHPNAGNSPAIPDGYVMVPMRLTAENGAKGVLSGEFSETQFVNCPECFGDDECETCDGSGRIEIKVPVSWTTIKEIWIKGVEHFAAAPQENN
nr:DUF550 domain-containing protein [Klebsiella grimontii]